jgi:tRNA threonylcarbamoyl adenosine modification protein YeaZ
MIILALDTTLASCSAALFDAGAGRMLAAEQMLMDKGHAEAIAPLVQRCLQKSGVWPSSINRIVVTNGPGTFTGLRIGLALAHGMGVALACEVVGLDTLSATAAPLLRKVPQLLVAHQAGATGNVYAAFFANGTLASPLLFAAPAEVLALAPEGAALIGTGADAIEALAAGRFKRMAGHDLPCAEEFAAFAADLPIAEGLPQPVYLREPDAKPQTPFAAEVIRLAVADDLPALAKLHQICFDDGWSEDSLRQSLSMPGVTALAAVRDGGIRAFLVLRAVADEAEVITLCTAPHWRRKALAEKLLAAGREMLRAQKIVALHLEVAADNGAAHALYLRQGFHETGRRKGYYARNNAAPCDAILMALAP